MKRGLFIVILSALSAISSSAITRTQGAGRLTYGVEWGYSAAFFKGTHFYFIAPEGFRVDDRQRKAIFNSNGEIYLHAGYNLSDKWNISLYAGYTGIGDFHTGIPVSARFTRYFGTNSMDDRWFAYCDLGSGISLKKYPQELLGAKLGGGYRLSMSRTTKLDFIAAIRFMHTHPQIDYFGSIIDKDSVDRNDGYILSASVGIGITF